ncbi:hypothetical protein NHH73_15290 [Oxalobacteraceae bacterium OTU3CINTB1]|nr:hypothetical protein NHH73_15290 [Oxalobacteraceae bacterium OTU3CINTB1]
MQLSRLFLFTACTCVALGAAAQTPNPFGNSANPSPPPSEYSGPMFKLSYAYPASALKPPMPWQAAIKNQPISVANASAYAEALKASIGDDMRVLLQDYKNWDAGKRGWYNEPWMASVKGDGTREPIHGMYVGSSDLDVSLFQKSGLNKSFTTYVLTYYDRTAAVTLNKIWGSSGMQPVMTKEATQFPEGAIIVKAAFTTVSAKDWPVMKGALSWPAYITTNVTDYPPPPNNPNFSPARKLTDTYLMQFDIIVKDSVSAPATGWVFTTLVYDSRITSPDVWKKMVVMGAQWGNDPVQKYVPGPQPPLVQNWVNPQAPPYASETLGWGGRLSGPNDGAMNDIVYPYGENKSAPFSNTKFKSVKNAQNSSCMSCHSSAQWSVAANTSPSFLLPALANPLLQASTLNETTDFVSPEPGSELWLKWFQNRKGDDPMDAGNIAADFDMVLTFKSLPAWHKATHPNPTRGALQFDLRGKRVVPLTQSTPAK